MVSVIETKIYVVSVDGLWHVIAPGIIFPFQNRHPCAGSWRAIIGDIVHNKCFGLLLVEVICSFIPPSVCAQPTPLLTVKVLLLLDS